MKKHYLIYKITNTKTNKFYIGAHETFDVNDGYMGSGVYLRRAQKKYGMESFIKEILIECSSAEEMWSKERELVELHEMSYNLMQGGHGGWEYARSKITPETYDKVRATMRTEEFALKTAEHRRASAIRIAEMQKDPAIRQKQAESLRETMNDPDWVATTGAERSAKISASVKALHAEGVYEERNKKLSSSRRGMKKATLRGIKIWVKESDPRILEDDFKYGW